ncbi:MAG: hypothetical protein UU85_C0001G0098 [Candidatus Wolfebacteria bacterium GW2011_GWA2_42_10]|uniref:Uncharacterized protein n=1 Tax=Candidatus Wolfebacteria bacterium GW2011_GWA2_42_10 TaxID=1619004 RepID=A0A0G1AK91_9BACT|nr:MAG: hypothetical protein UU85_C0001G0098 [Candidatus Wolfebacteria bacterium GW2011_GWA2_42_10]
MENFFPQLKELFNLTILLINKLAILFEKLGWGFWKIFSGIFVVILQFTIDLVKLILSYL